MGAQLTLWSIGYLRVWEDDEIPLCGWEYVQIHWNEITHTGQRTQPGIQHVWPLGIALEAVEDSDERCACSIDHAGGQKKSGRFTSLVRKVSAISSA